jgi:hypothetical protein
MAGPLHTEDPMTDIDASADAEFKPITNQDELDRRVGERLARERQKFADYDDLKAKAAKFDEAQAASKTELQQLQDAIAERDAKLADLPRQARAEAIRFSSKATAKGFLDPEDALTFLAADVDLSDDAAVEAALDALAERKPHLLRIESPKKKLPARPKPDAGDEGTQGDQPAGKERAAAALRQFRNT